MSESLWAIISSISPFIGAHLFVGTFYTAFGFILGKFFNVQMKNPTAIKYFPVALFGAFYGNYFVEAILYKSEFWVTRHANSFHYESLQGLSILFGLLTYYISLKNAHLLLSKMFPQYFINTKMNVSIWQKLKVIFIYSMCFFSTVILLMSIHFRYSLYGFFQNQNQVNSIENSIGYIKGNTFIAIVFFVFVLSLYLSIKIHLKKK